MPDNANTTNFDRLNCDHFAIGGTPVTSVLNIAAHVAPLTEGGSAVGGTNDGDLPSLAASLGAAVATTAPTNSTPYGFSQQQALDLIARVNTLITAVTDVRAAARENAAKQNAIISALQAAGIMASS